jgi:peptidoglycan/LPS O-acetylase OafA/YrhL
MILGGLLSAPPTLGARAVDRRNNLNFLRLLAALGVMVQHAALLTGGYEAMPWAMWLLGHVCVGAFFAISGFLIPGSFERAASAGDFVLARALRIMPALALCVLLTALALGPLVTTLAPTDYLDDPRTTAFVIGNLSLFWETRPLPGVFEGNPVPHAQITFWTLKHEAAAYAMVLVLGLAGLLRNRVGLALLLVMFGAVSVLIVRTEASDPAALPEGLLSFRRVATYFCFGIVAHVLRERLPLSGAACLALLTLTHLFWWTPLFHVLLPLTVAYGTLWLAYVPRGPILGFNRLGDYSYGVYVFAVPVQQLCVMLLEPHGAAANTLYALGPTMLLAALSWHLVEKPSLALRHGASARPRHIGPGPSPGAARAELAARAMVPPFQQPTPPAPREDPR